MCVRARADGFSPMACARERPGDGRGGARGLAQPESRGKCGQSGLYLCGGQQACRGRRADAARDPPQPDLPDVVSEYPGVRPLQDGAVRRGRKSPEARPATETGVCRLPPDPGGRASRTGTHRRSPPRGAGSHAAKPRIQAARCRGAAGDRQGPRHACALPRRAARAGTAIGLAMNTRTRFAPSPTGFLHIGGARTALFCWAYARRHGGKFIMRIEDTDLERSTRQSVEAILESMKWLGLDWDEGPFFQMQRVARYKEVAEQLIAAGHAYRDYMPKDELDKLRQEQLARGEKPRYDRAVGMRFRDGSGPAVVRFKTPQEGEVGWHDLVKGPISFPNKELDDLVLLRADGVPTYNFGVVVDDLDMDITHVIRGDDHVNNTPRQIHIFRVLVEEKKIPSFAHLPMILGPDGERLSKRHGAVSVMQYRDEGFLPEALLNYLARLGWSHGNEEVFTLKQMVEWFDLAHVSRSPAKFDPEKALWMNQEYIKNGNLNSLLKLTEEMLEKMNVNVKNGPPLDQVLSLLKDRANTLQHLAEAARLFYAYEEPSAKTLAELLNDKTRPALQMLKAKLADTPWDRKSLGAAVSAVLKASGLKMPELAMPARLLVTGRTQTPSLDAVLELLGRETVLARLSRYLKGD